MAYEQKKVASLVNGDAFEGFLLVKSISVRTGSTGKNYVDLTLADENSSINAKIWDYYDALSRIEPGRLVKVRGTVTVASDADRDTVIAAAEADAKIAPYLEGKTVVKEIAVPGKLVNIVVR